MDKKTLVIGPATCELGWMLMTFNPYCRAIARGYDRVIVCCPRGEEHIWEFATEFYTVSKPDRADRWLIKNGRPIKSPKALRIAYPNADFVVPNKKTCTSKKRLYKCFRNRPIISQPNVIIHARATLKYNQTNRNWPTSNFEKIVKAFPGVQFHSIGTQADYIKGTEDARNWQIGHLCSLLSEAKMIIGPSSGPMHLATLCKTPQIVWTGRKREKAIKGTNRDRYEQIWNPFNTGVKVIDKYGWNPPVEVVIKAMNNFLS